MALENDSIMRSRQASAEAAEARLQEARAERQSHLDFAAGQLAISLVNEDGAEPLLTQRVATYDHGADDLDVMDNLLTPTEKERLPEAKAIVDSIFKALTVKGLRQRSRTRIVREPRAR